jgi:nitrite reductase/ring-hydroxylating ferredoxin subunit
VPKRKAAVFVCASSALAEHRHRVVELLYRGDSQTAIVLRYQNRVYAYINQCVHMPKRLDCERNAVFDPDSGLLRCSMHGIQYDPRTGIAVSSLCEGASLQALRIVDDGRTIVITDKRVAVP